MPRPPGTVYTGIPAIERDWETLKRRAAGVLWAIAILLVVLAVA